MCTQRRLGVRLGAIIKCYESRKRESGCNHTKYRLRDFLKPVLQRRGIAAGSTFVRPASRIKLPQLYQFLLPPCPRRDSNPRLNAHPSYLPKLHTRWANGGSAAANLGLLAVRPQCIN